MEKIRVIIVGGVAGGASAAARLRRINEDAEIILFEKGEYISYANCGLPYYVGEVITDKEALVVQTPEIMGRRFRLDIRMQSEVTGIDLQRKTVEVIHHPTGHVYQESFDKLVLSPGAEPLRPPIPGLDAENVFTIRNIPDTYAIKDYIDRESPRQAVVVGGGFIGLEMAENLHQRGIKVAVVEMADQVMAPLDYDMAAIVHQHLVSKGVELYLRDGVKEIHHHERGSTVKLQSGKIIETDLIILGIGVRPDVRLAKEAGLVLGPLQGIQVNRYLQTSHPDVYAIGDAIEVEDLVSGQPALIPLAGPANKQGRIAANHICGYPDAYKATQGTSIVKVFDLTVAVTGNNEKNLTRHQLPYVKSFTHSASHAGYYPGAIPMSIKLIFNEQDGRILGGQIVGWDGVDKRIDVLATALRSGLTVYDLQELELAYAPPFSSAKDPVNMAGYVAANILKGDHPIVHWHDLQHLEEDCVLIDVRTREEYEAGSIANAINLPLDDLRERLHELPTNKNLIIYCQVGLRGYLAVKILLQKGYKAWNLSGGYRTYLYAQSDRAGDEPFGLTAIARETQGAAPDGELKTVEGSLVVDTCGLQCPGPIAKVYREMKKIRAGERMEVWATDPAIVMDMKAWCQRTGNVYEGFQTKEHKTVIQLRKGGRQPLETVREAEDVNDKTMVVFSGDLDKALASFIIAHGAAAMGRKVTMFFTFWGLNILRRPEPVKVKKTFLEAAFGKMMPRGAGKLGLSRMNMGGAGSKMIQYIMEQKNVDNLSALIKQARESGVQMVACSMSMDLMGIKAEELIEGVTIGGVASYLAAAETADTNLFI